MGNIKKWGDFITESNSSEDKVLDLIKKKMQSDRKEYKGDIPTKYNPGMPWSDSGWLVDEISSFLRKSYLTSYTLKLTEPFSKEYTYEELDNILKANFSDEYLIALDMLKE